MGMWKARSHKDPQVTSQRERSERIRSVLVRILFLPFITFCVVGFLLHFAGPVALGPSLLLGESFVKLAASCWFGVVGLTSAAIWIGIAPAGESEAGFQQLKYGFLACGVCGFGIALLLISFEVLSGHAAINAGWRWVRNGCITVGAVLVFVATPILVKSYLRSTERYRRELETHDNDDVQ